MESIGSMLSQLRKSLVKRASAVCVKLSSVSLSPTGADEADAEASSCRSITRSTGWGPEGGWGSQRGMGKLGWLGKAPDL